MLLHTLFCTLLLALSPTPGGAPTNAMVCGRPPPCTAACVNIYIYIYIIYIYIHREKEREG